MKEKKVLILSIVAVMLLILAVSGATYAYFEAQEGKSTSADINVDTSTVDNFSFLVGNQISISADQSNFGETGTSQSGSTYAEAKLVANSDKRKATYYYDVLLEVTENDYVHTQNSSTPELLLNIVDEDGNEVTSGINGLNYTSVTTVDNKTLSGWDITELIGIKTLIDNNEITSTGTTEETAEIEKWTVTITFVNLNADQEGNTKKTFTANLKIKKAAPEASEVCTSGTSTLAECITSLRNENGDNSLYLHDSKLENSANDNSIRYSGRSDEVNNYVCFGSSEETCPEDNLYRIIGVFDGEVKLIKATQATSAMLGTDGMYSSDNSYYWGGKDSTTYTQIWANTELNTVNMNKNFVNYLGKTYMAMVDSHVWIVGGNTYSNISVNTVVNAYQSEIKSPIAYSDTSISTTYEDEIGLMYVSDYGYAAEPRSWTAKLYDGSYEVDEEFTEFSSDDYSNRMAKGSNWMWIGDWEWTITRQSDSSSAVFLVRGRGLVRNHDVWYSLRVRPCFYLNSNVLFTGGDGSSANPFRVLNS